MFRLFHCHVNFNPRYVYGARHSIGLVAVLDIEQDILSISTFTVCHKQNGLSK